jgi:hypothetical protein
MTMPELKSRLIEKINQMTDDALLLDLYKLVADRYEENELFQVSDAHKIAIEKAINQIEKGDFLSNDQANKEISKWLNK